MADIHPDTQTVTVTPALAVTDIHKRFGPFEVLRGISLSAHEHEVVTILGSSGSGKSTLLRCINLLEIPDSGDISCAASASR